MVASLVGIGRGVVSVAIWRLLLPFDTYYIRSKSQLINLCALEIGTSDPFIFLEYHALIMIWMSPQKTFC